MPLIQEDHDAAEEDAGAGSLRERVRKVKPQYTEGPLVKAGWAPNQAQAEFIQGLLLEEGIPSTLRRSRGFDVPDFLAAGPRDVLVAQSAAIAAREVLLQSELIDPRAEAAGSIDPPWRILAGIVFVLAVFALLVWLLT